MSKPLGSQLTNQKLREALKRRKAARAIAEILDISVPLSHVTSINILRSDSDKPTIRTLNKSELSPYTIHLSTHEVADGLCELAITQPNLLTPEVIIQNLEHPFDPLADLSLEPKEILKQMNEGEFGKWRVEIKEGERQGEGDDEETQVTSMETYFVLPELDVIETPVLEQESDLVTFEEMVSKHEQATKEDEFISQTNDEPIALISSEPSLFRRPLLIFVLIACLVILPFGSMRLYTSLVSEKSAIEDSASSALTAFKDGASNIARANLIDANASFALSKQAFADAESHLDSLGAITSTLISLIPNTGETYRTGTKLIEAGALISDASTRVSEGFIRAQSELHPTTVSRLRILTTYLSSALPSLQSANETIASINPDNVPSAQSDNFLTLQSTLPKLVDSLTQFLVLSDTAETLLGGNGTKRYLLVFQNNTEIRATGGFMGSFAEIQLNDGEIEALSIPGGGTYDLQGTVKKFIAAPEPLQLLNDRFEFQDANWFPDFPTSSRKMIDLYESSGGGTVDGVIAVNATYVQKLIGMLGPIEMQDYGITITEENFLSETQNIVENEYDREINKPKAFIGDLAPELLSRIIAQTPHQFLKMISEIEIGLNTRDIQMYLTNNEIQSTVQTFGYGGELKQTDDDYFFLVNTNLGGGKTDGVISEDVQLATIISEDGVIEHTVSVTRTHHGVNGDEFTGVNNVNYVRVYVPKGAKLISADGFTIPSDYLFDRPNETYLIDDDILYAMDTLEIHDQSLTAVYQESGKTVFGNWTQTKPGSSSTYHFTYTIPQTVSFPKTKPLLALAKKMIGIRETEPYQLYIQKQSGVQNRTTQVTIQTPSDYKTIWQSNPDTIAKFENDSDHLFGMIFEMDNH